MPLKGRTFFLGRRTYGDIKSKKSLKKKKNAETEKLANELEHMKIESKDVQTGHVNTISASATTPVVMQSQLQPQSPQKPQQIQPQSP